MKIEKEFVPFPIARALKKIGYDELCLGYYEQYSTVPVINFNNKPLTKEELKRPKMYKVENKNSTLPQWAIAAPLYQQVFKWFREKHKLDSFIAPNKLIKETYISQIWAEEGIVLEKFVSSENKWSSDFHLNYEKAQLECLKRLIKVIKTRKSYQSKNFYEGL
jgi:hypothetical protein